MLFSLLFFYSEFSIILDEKLKIACWQSQVIRTAGNRIVLIKPVQQLGFPKLCDIQGTFA